MHSLRSLLKARKLAQNAPDGYTVHARLLDDAQNAIVEQDFPIQFGSNVDEMGHAVCTMDYEQMVLSPSYGALKSQIYTHWSLNCGTKPAPV